MQYGRMSILERIRENRDNHVNAFEKAMEGYLVEVIEELEKVVKESQFQLNEVKKHGLAAWKNHVFYVKATKPEDHREDYDQVIDMLQMSNLDTIELDRDEFTKYVRDEWAWSKKFAETTTNLISKSNR